MVKRIFRSCLSALVAVSLALCSTAAFATDGGGMSGDSSGKTNIVTYPVPEGPELNSSYAVKVRPEGAGDDEWLEVPVFKARVMSNGARWAGMVYFDCDGAVEVQVTVNGDVDYFDDIDEATGKKKGLLKKGSTADVMIGENTVNMPVDTRVYPESYGIIPEYEEGGNVITFTAKPNQRIVLDPNGDTRRNLQIWTGDIMNLPKPEELEADGKTVTVIDASKGDKLQYSYDTDVVYVKPGYYDSGFALKNNQTMYLEGGAVIHETISMDYTTNAKLIGRGMIYRPQYAAITVNDAVNAYVDGMMSINYSWANNGGYGINIANGKNVVIKNVKSIGNGKWGDCMDIFCSEDVTVEGCFFRGNDDCIAIYGPRWTGNYWGDTGNVRNIKVKQCVLMPDLARPIHFGTHGDSSSPNGGRVIDNCRFEDIDILTYNKYAWRLEWNKDKEINEFKRMPQPIRMDVSEGNTVTNIYFNNIRIQDYMANELVELFITTQDRYGTYTYPGKAINNIYFKDIDYKNSDETFTSRIEGYKTSDGIDGITQNITFENVKVNGEVANSAADIHANVGNNVKNLKFVKSGEAKYVYNPAIVPEDIWPEYYDYAGVDGASASAEVSENGSKPSAVLDDDDKTVWYSAVSESDSVYDEAEKTLTGNGITVDIGEQRHINAVRITWANPALTHDYRIYVSKDGTDWSAGHSDEHGIGAVNPRTRADCNKRVKTNWLANQHDPNQNQDNIIGRYIKIIPQKGSQLDIAKLEILGADKPSEYAREISLLTAEDEFEEEFDDELEDMSDDDIMLLADSGFTALNPDNGAAGDISNGGEWTIYASKAGQIKANSGVLEDVTASGKFEVTKDKRSAGLQFDLSSKDTNEAANGKVIKSAKLRLTPIVTRAGVKHSLYEIDNKFSTSEGGKPVAEFETPRGNANEIDNDSAVKAVTSEGLAKYPDELSVWQSDIDITGNVISASDNTLSLHVAYLSGNADKTEYSTCNIEDNLRLKAIPLLYSGGVTDYSKWAYPQIVFTYTDDADYTSAYNDFIEANTALLQAEITETETVSAPAVTGGSNITFEAADDVGLVTVQNNVISYNPSYAGGAAEANVKLTVTKGEASYSKIVPIAVNAAPSYEISFSADKNPLGEISVTVGSDTSKNGTAYAKEGGIVTVNAGENVGYGANIIVKKGDGSELEVNNGSFIMPAEPVNVSVEYSKIKTYGTSRIAAINSASIRNNGQLQSPDIVIGADRITFVKFDLSGYNSDVISDAEISFNMTKATPKLNTKAVFYVPNNDWTENSMSTNFSFDGTDDKKISAFKYTDAGVEKTISLYNGENHQALIIPDGDDASTAAEGILKDFYIGSTGKNKTSTFSVTDAIKTALSKSSDGIVTLMIYSTGDGNDASSVQNASTLAARPSLTITESSEYLPDDELITEINTVEDLENFAAIVNGGNNYAGKTVTLAKDLDLSDVYNQEGKSWTPIGTQDIGGLKPFAGTFDGGDNTISGLYINAGDSSNQGLFGIVTGTIQNLTVSGEINGGSIIGGIAGSCSGNITNCHSRVNIIAQREAGGIVGTLSAGGAVSNCDNAGNVKIENKETYAGGIAGHNIEGIVDNCSNTGKIENGLNGFRNKLGGIVGFLDNGEVRDSNNTGDVVSEAETASYIADTTQNYVGGIVGYSSYGTIINGSNSGAVHNAVDYTGGIAGLLQSGNTVSMCTNNGRVSGKGYVGGITGCNYSDISECKNDGAVTGTGEYIGGVIGYLSIGNVHDCAYDETLNNTLNIVGFNSAGTVTFTGESIENSIKYVDEKAVVTVKEAGKYTVIFAAYDQSGVLSGIDVQTLQLNVGEQTVPPSQSFSINGAKTVKVMLWNGLDKMEPLCSADEK